MIDTDKYEGHIQGEWRDTRHEGALAHHIVAYNPQIAYANDAGDVQICTVSPNEATANLVTDAPLLLEEVKRLRETVKTVHNLNLWEKAEVKRLREENNRYLDFIFWLGIEHKGKKLAWEYGDEKIVEML